MVNDKIIQSSTPMVNAMVNPSSSTANTKRTQPRASTTIIHSSIMILFHHSMAAKTISNLANQCLLVQTSPLLHQLDEWAKLVIPENQLQPISPSPPALASSNLLEPPVSEAYTKSTLNAPNVHDPSLPSTGEPLSDVDDFVDNVVGLSQKYYNSRQVWRMLMLNAIDAISFIHWIPPTVHSAGSPHQQKWLFLSPIKLILGPNIDTVSTIIHLPPHRLECLTEF